MSRHLCTGYRWSNLERCWTRGEWSSYSFLTLQWGYAKRNQCQVLYFRSRAGLSRQKVLIRKEWGSTQRIILTSAYVLHHFLSGRLIYQVEWCRVGSRIDRPSWVRPDWSLRGLSQETRVTQIVQMQRVWRVMAKDNTIIQIQIVAMVQVFL